MTFHHELNARQRQAVETLQGPVMVVAGPGSGKTRVLTCRIARLIEAGVPPHQILALTFTNKAANEMRERVVRLVGEKSGGALWMGTFHSMFARLLRIDGAKLGYDRNFTIYDAQDSLGLIRSAMNDLGVAPQRVNPQALRSRISGAKNQLISPDAFAAQAADFFDEQCARVYAEYEARLRASNAMDFDDLLVRPIDLFERHKASLERWQDRFRFLLVDEYQDTNRAQYVLMKLLASKFRNVCVVGDDAQSIYGFRGADIRNMLDFGRDYPDAAVIRLEQNYRSTKTILAAADRVIRHNVDRIAKELWTENAEGEPITVLACEDDREEGAAIVARIHDESHRLKLDLRNFAVMYRTNAQSRSIEEALNQNNIRYVMVGGVRFYERKEIKDVMAYFRVLVNPKDGESFLRIVNTPARGVGAAALTKLRAFAAAEGLTLTEAASRVAGVPGIGAKGRTGLAALAAMLEKYRGLRSAMSTSELTRALVDETGILSLFKEEGTPEAMGRWENVQELLSAIAEYAATGPEATLENFLQEKALLADADQWDDRQNAVTLLTLHAAKGLEFPVVFITGLEEGLLPFARGDVAEPSDIEEERRLYYVGLTRAMRKLYLSHVRLRYRFAQLTYRAPSPFLAEIPAELTETVRGGRGTFGERRAARTPLQPRRRRGAAAGGGGGEHYYRDAIPDYDLDMVDALKVGRLVQHDVFGKGKILQLSGDGDALKAVVDFPSAGRKSLLLKYAHLKLIA